MADVLSILLGAIKDDGYPVWYEGILKDEALLLSDSSLRVIPHCTMGSTWEFGSISAPDPNPENIDYLVSFGTIVMAQTASLTILSLATGNRVSPKRLWRLAMHQGFSEGQNAYGLYDVDYYPGTCDPREQNPAAVPSFSPEDIIALESLGDTELIKNAIIHAGGFWMWMRPDW